MMTMLVDNENTLIEDAVLRIVLPRDRAKSSNSEWTCMNADSCYAWIRLPADEQHQVNNSSFRSKMKRRILQRG